MVKAEPRHCTSVWPWSHTRDEGKAHCLRNVSTREQSAGGQNQSFSRLPTGKMWVLPVFVLAGKGKKQESSWKQAGRPRPTCSGGVITALRERGLHQRLVRRFPELHQLVPTLSGLSVETGVLITGSMGKVRQPTVESRNWDRKHPEHLGANVNGGERGWQRARLLAGL